MTTKSLRIMGITPVTPVVINTLRAVEVIVVSLIFFWAIQTAYQLRTYALTDYGMVIHEFDPWFNFRATQYLSKHGPYEFLHWFDYMSWYPLGRPVGTTIYPGLQFTAVAIHRVLRWLGPDYKMSLNDVCCTMPCWFGAVTSVLTGLMAKVVVNSWLAGAFTAAIMAIIPAHMMRSVGGGFDNESIAVCALVLTFLCWVRSLQGQSVFYGLLTGIAYGYMVAAWGGYIFVLNMIALHAAAQTVMDVVRNRYSASLYKSYTIFYIVGTALAMQVPPVGYAPFKSLEQLAALVVFFLLQAVRLSEVARVRQDMELRSVAAVRLRLRYIAGTLAAMSLVAVTLAPTGFFGPLSSRIRGLFVRHTRTGNPLVDSVAEHQPASADAYWHYLHLCCHGWAQGFVMLCYLRPDKNPKILFVALYCGVAYYFSLRMSRLMILAGPIASLTTGMFLASVVRWAVRQLAWDGTEEGKAVSERNAPAVKKRGGESRAEANDVIAAWSQTQALYARMRPLRTLVGVFLLILLLSGTLSKGFYDHCNNMAQGFSHPQLMFKSRTSDGRIIIVDDYREAYHWLRDKTPTDSRVMAWWDYGYQITGIGNRTSIADGNTWNHEHIATLGKCLTSPVVEAHALIRHLADYVLIWAGGGGDDLAKSPHMARIGNSVYRDICPEDPLCEKFGFYGGGRKGSFENPTPMMRKSLLYHLHSHNVVRGVRMPTQYFTEVFSSKHGLVRIFQVMNVSAESKAWVADPSNRICDAPGSWYCVGQYPPAPELQALLKKRRDFGQLEDFNAKKADDAYYRSYMQRMGAM